MKKLLLLLPLLALLTLLLSACSASTGAPDYAPGEENRLVIYTSHKEEVYRPLIREFEERTGIWVELVTGGTSELLGRIAQEKAAPKADIMFGGGVESLESYRDLFSGVPCAGLEAVPESMRQPDNTWIPFSALPVVFIYNTKLVASGELTGWQDLLRPEYDGRIAFADPARSGSSFTALVTGLYACGEETMRALAQRLQSNILPSSGDVPTAVADGTCLVGITLEETALQRIAAGDNLAIVYPADGTSCVPDGTAMIAGAPHRENAVRFLEFTLSREVQQLLGSRFYRRPVRDDVATRSSLRPMESIAMVDYSAAWAAEHREVILSDWADAVKGADK